MILPAENSPHTRQKFAGVERLGQIVVGADLQPHDTIDIFSAGGQEHDADARLLANSLEYVEAVHSGQHDVEQNQSPWPLPRCLQTGIASMRRLYAKSMLAQILREHPAKFHIIVDQKYIVHATLRL